jgi:AraC family transcriptional regulator
MATQFAEFDAAELELPAVRLSCSHDLQWQSVHARSYREDGHTDAFTTVPTDNLLVVLITGGIYSIKSRSGSRWHETVYRPGSIGITAPGNASTLRWTSLTKAPLTSTHLYLSPQVFTDVAAVRRSTPSLESLPDALAADDPTVSTISAALAWALETNASALYADSAAQFLAAHLIERAATVGREPAGNGLGDRALKDVLDYMHAHLAHDVTLDHLSSVAGLSKHHFLRSFKASTGVTPHRFLTEIRLRRAADLLRSTSRTISGIGAQCGYRNGSHFAAAFRDFHGFSPAQYRQSLA